MRAKGFVCPNLSSIFRPSVAATAEPAVLDVARAIYYGGRADGLPGLEAVAHIIQNRCCHPDFPSDPWSVVLSGTAQFMHVGQDARMPQTTAERQLFSQARRLATQLVNPPQHLPFPDPTGGAIYYDQRGPASLNSRSRPFADSRGIGGSSSSGSESGAMTGRPPRLSSSNRGADASELPDPPSEDDIGTAERPRPSPQSRRPLSFFRDRGLRSGEVPGPGHSVAALQRAASGSAARAIATARASPGAAFAAAGGSAAPATMSSTPPPTPPPSSPAPRPMLPGRDGPGGLPLHRPLMSLHRGPADEDGYHDIVLPCGLFQEEVIGIMYRDLSPEDFDMLNKLDERVPKRNIVQRNLVDRLPVCLAADCGCSECGVCLAELDPNARVVQLPCRHAFHSTCISKWLTQCKNTCPLCSALIDTNQTAQAQEKARAQNVARSHEAAARALSETRHTV